MPKKLYNYLGVASLYVGAVTNLVANAYRTAGIRSYMAAEKTLDNLMDTSGMEQDPGIIEKVNESVSHFFASDQNYTRTTIAATALTTAAILYILFTKDKKYEIRIDK